MTRLRVLLADDEPPALERLALAFRDMADVDVVGLARNGTEARDGIVRLRPDLAVLDIRMPGLSGLGVLGDLPADTPRPEVIFLTAFEHHAVDAFELEAADYLLKPLRLDRLRVAVERARRRRGERALAAPEPAAAAGDFWIPGRDGATRVPLASVVWIEAARDYVLLHTDKRSHMLRATMGALERRLAGSDLMRVHRSAFVRPSAVAEVQAFGGGGMMLVLEDGAAVPVGPSYLALVRERFGKGA